VRGFVPAIFQGQVGRLQAWMRHAHELLAAHLGGALELQSGGALKVMGDASTAFTRPAEEARSRVVEISPHDLSWAKPSPLILDVREAGEYAEGHIEGARSLSGAILEQNIGRIIPDLSSPVVVYCSGGERGALAAANLLKMGYRNVRSLKGGLRNWLESGGTVETSRRFPNPCRKRLG